MQNNFSNSQFENIIMLKKYRTDVRVKVFFSKFWDVDTDYPTAYFFSFILYSAHWANVEKFLDILSSKFNVSDM